MDVYDQIELSLLGDSSMNFDNQKHNAAVQRIKVLFMAGHPCSVSFSSGKDSSELLDITFTAALLAKSDGAEPYILVLTSDTGIENPEITQHVKEESKKIKEYAKQHNLKLEHHIASPLLNDTWAVQVISGRSLPSFSSTNSDCTIDFKINPINRLRKKLLTEITAERNKEVITLVGTRLDESVARKIKMDTRNENEFAPARNKDGDLVYAAIADFTVEDVWEWIGLVRSGLIPSYSDFNELTRIYADAGNTLCAVISDAITEGLKKERGSCGASLAV